MHALTHIWLDRGPFSNGSMESSAEASSIVGQVEASLLELQAKSGQIPGVRLAASLRSSLSYCTRRQHAHGMGCCRLLRRVREPRCFAKSKRASFKVAFRGNGGVCLADGSSPVADTRHGGALTVATRPQRRGTPQHERSHDGDDGYKALIRIGSTHFYPVVVGMHVGRRLWANLVSSCSVPRWVVAWGRVNSTQIVACPPPPLNDPIGKIPVPPSTFLQYVEAVCQCQVQLLTRQRCAPHTCRDSPRQGCEAQAAHSLPAPLRGCGLALGHRALALSMVLEGNGHTSRMHAALVAMHHQFIMHGNWQTPCMRLCCAGCGALLRECRGTPADPPTKRGTTAAPRRCHRSQSNRCSLDALLANTATAWCVIMVPCLCARDQAPGQRLWP